jgi:tripartite-type tricarboxylate transporter receptor subunit TctC
MAPAGTPASVVTRLNEAVNAILTRPETREAQLRQGAEAMVMSPAEFDAFLRADIAKQAEWIRMAGMTAG